jgi:two-component system sensor histidine kinase AlgZ
MVQPLLENAVYHGIEPRTEPGTIHIKIHREGNRVHIVLRNPYKAGDHHAGNRMALGNIRERLALHFDAEASIKSEALADWYEVRIAFPYLTGST